MTCGEALGHENRTESCGKLRSGLNRTSSSGTNATPMTISARNTTMTENGEKVLVFNLFFNPLTTSVLDILFKNYIQIPLIHFVISLCV